MSLFDDPDETKDAAEERPEIQLSDDREEMLKLYVNCDYFEKDEMADHLVKLVGLKWAEWLFNQVSDTNDRTHLFAVYAKQGQGELVLPYSDKGYEKIRWCNRLVNKFSDYEDAKKFVDANYCDTFRSHAHIDAFAYFVLRDFEGAKSYLPLVGPGPLQAPAYAMVASRILKDSNAVAAISWIEAIEDEGIRGKVLSILSRELDLSDPEPGEMNRRKKS